MPAGPQFAYGTQRLIDSWQRFARATAPMYLRLRNFDFNSTVGNQLWAQLGFQLTPVNVPTGTVDILITPPPSVRQVSVHNIGMSNGKLRFGAKIFLISQTFVAGQMQAQELTDQTLVWRGPNVVGLVADGLLYSIEDVTHQEISGQTVTWRLSCNANELR